jgi:hypothetical protein
LGGVPTAFVSGEHNFLTLPFVLGLGVPLSPSRFFTITPWYELAISVNADSVISTADIPIDESWIRTDPNTGRPISLSPDAVNQALAQGVTMDVSVAVPMRFGVEAALHATRTVDFNLYGMFSTLGAAFSGDSVATIGGSLLVRWDDIAPAVLPPKKEDESCEAVERRFRACPVSQQWLSPEQRSQPTSAPASSAPPQPAAPPSAPPAAPPPPPASTPPSAPPSAPAPGPAPSAPPGQSAFPSDPPAP